LSFLPAAHAEDEPMWRRVAPHLVKRVDIASGEEVEVLGKAAIVFLQDGRRGYFRNEDLRGLIADPEIESPKGIGVKVVKLSCVEEPVRLVDGSVSSGLVITCRVRISAGANPELGPRDVGITFPNLVSTSELYEAPGFNRMLPTFRFHVIVWESPAALAASAAAVQHRAQLLIDPHDAARAAAAAAVERQKTEEEARWAPARQRGNLWRPWFYVVEGALFLLFLIASIVVRKRTSKRLGRFVLMQGQPLPSICMGCGAPATNTMPHTFHWSTIAVAEVPRLVQTIFQGICWAGNFVGLRLAKQSNFEIDAPLCHRHRNHWTWRGRGILALLFLAWPVVAFICIALPASVLAHNHDPLPLIGGIVIGIFGWPLAAALIILTTIRCRAMGRNSVTLLGVSREFIRAAQASLETSVAAPGETLMAPPKVDLAMMTGVPEAQDDSAAP
jgi:hypothetical protein